MSVMTTLTTACKYFNDRLFCLLQNAVVAPVKVSAAMWALLGLLTCLLLQCHARTATEVPRYHWRTGKNLTTYSRPAASHSLSGTTPSLSSITTKIWLNKRPMVVPSSNLKRASTKTSYDISNFMKFKQKLGNIRKLSIAV